MRRIVQYCMSIFEELSTGVVVCAACAVTNDTK